MDLDGKPAFDTKQAAQYLGNYSRGTLRNWRSQGKGPRWFKGATGRAIYLIADLDEFRRTNFTEGGVAPVPEGRPSRKPPTPPRRAA